MLIFRLFGICGVLQGLSGSKILIQLAYAYVRDRKSSIVSRCIAIVSSGASRACRCQYCAAYESRGSSLKVRDARDVVVSNSKIYARHVSAIDALLRISWTLY